MNSNQGPNSSSPALVELCSPALSSITEASTYVYLVPQHHDDLTKHLPDLSYSLKVFNDSLLCFMCSEATGFRKTVMAPTN